MLDHHKVETVFDIGANIGQYAQNLRKAGFRGRIISFEPLAINHLQLKKISEDDPKWEIAPRMAVGQTDGNTIIHVSQNNDMSSILPVAEIMLRVLPKSRIVETEEVPLHRIDSIFSQFVTSEEKFFVKVDTQGFEMPILEGATESMNNGRIIGWQLELSLIPLYAGERTYEDIINYLKLNGFEMHLVLPGYFSKKILRLLQIDGEFFRK